MFARKSARPARQNAAAGTPRFPARRLAVSLAAALVGLSGWGAIQAAPSVQPAEWVKGRVIVETRAGLSEAETAKAVKPHGGKLRRIGKTQLFVVDLPAQASETAVAAMLKHHPQFKSVELDAIVKPALVTNDPYLGSQWHSSKVRATAAWDNAMGAGVTIAILDSGVDGAHPDLAANMVPGWNVVGNNADTSDSLGHGTAVAGTAAAALNNATGVAGVAGRAKIMPIRITDANGYATGSAVAQGLTFAADNGARVANVSFAGVVGNSTIETAAQYMKSRGGLVVVAAGNNGVLESMGPSTTLIPVSATESNDSVATWSSYGNFVAVAAPGNYIWTTKRGGSYGQYWGTSVASPVAAGVVALMMAARPDLPNAQIETLLYSSATDLGAAGRDIYYGHGLVDAASAVAAALAAAVADTQAPTASITSPAASGTVSGLANVDVGASDNVGVTRVELKVNGALVATDTSSPYRFSWDTTTVPNGMASLVAVAYDAAGNSKASSAVGVNVANAVAVDTTPPNVLISNPANGAKVSGNVSIRVAASDNGGDAGIAQTLYIDGKRVASVTGASLSYNWNTRKVSGGSHTIAAVAQDAAGNKTTVTIQVTR